MPLVAKAAKSRDLKTLLGIHLKETKGHVKALESAAKSLGRELPSKGCKQMTKLIGEGVKIIAKRLGAGNKDQELIGAGRKIEQFEIENYRPLVAEAERLEFTHEAALLTSILNQEKLANELLAALAQGKGRLDQTGKKRQFETCGCVDVHGPNSAGSVRKLNVRIKRSESFRDSAFAARCVRLLRVSSSQKRMADLCDWLEMQS